LAEIDLQLIARRRFDADRRELGDMSRASKVRHHSLNRTEREVVVLLARAQPAC
jgi:hypothetical protein